jgi:tetratricopeptide (TPR) repeat protein
MRFTLYHQGQFTLGLARVNDPRQRNEIVSRLKEGLFQKGLRLVHLDISNRHPESLRQALQHHPDGRLLLQKPVRAVLAITGMEHLIEETIVSGGRPPFAAALNAERDILRSTLPVPVILFMTDIAMDRLDMSAPDFFDWYSSSFHFQSTSLAAPRAESPSNRVPRQLIVPPAKSEKSLEQMELERRRLSEDSAVDRPLLAKVLLETGMFYAALPGFSDRQLAVSYLNQASILFRELKDTPGEATALARLAEVYYWIDDYEQAAVQFLRAVELYRKVDDQLNEAACLQHLGDVYIQISEMQAAGQRYRDALNLYRKWKHNAGASACVRSLGDVARLTGDYTTAERRYRAALPLYRQLQDRLGEANCVQSVGDIMLHQGEYRRAQIRYREALDIYSEIANQLGEANCLQGLGHIARLQGDLTTARNRYNDALEVYRAIGYRLGEAGCIESLGDLCRRREDYESGEKYYMEALSIYRSLHNRLGEANSYYGLGEMFFQKGNYETAGQFFRRAEAIYRKAEARLGEANTLAARGAIALMSDDVVTAGETLQKACSMYMDIGDRYSIAAQTGNYGWLLYEKGKLKEAQLFLLRAAEYFTVLGLHDQAERHQRAGERG